MQRMLDAGVSTRRGVMNAHLERAYLSDGDRAHGCRAASARSERGVILPLVPSMTASQVQEVCDILAAAIEPRHDASRPSSTVTPERISRH